MKKGLTILIKENNQIIITSTLGNMIIASKEYKNSVNKLEFCLTDFISIHSICCSSLNKIIIICDIAKLKTNSSANIEKDIAYIQLISDTESYKVTEKIINENRVKIHTFNTGLFENNSFKNNLKNAVNFLNENNITKVAINSYFSTIDSKKEKECIELMNQFSSSNLTILPSHIYNISNYLMRGNFSLLNLMHLETANYILNKLKSIFDNLSISCPLFFLKGDGTLATINTIKYAPLLTCFSEYTGKIVGSSYITNNKNSIVISNDNINNLASEIRNLLPNLTHEFSNLYGFRIPNFFPKSIQINSHEPRKIKNFFNHIQMNNDDFIPIINLTKESKISSLTNPIFNVKDSPDLPCIGASIANYKTEFSSIVFNTSDLRNNQEKEKLLASANKFIKDNKIDLNDISYNFEILPLKYMIHNSCYIKLILEGKM